MESKPKDYKARIDAIKDVDKKEYKEMKKQYEYSKEMIAVGIRYIETIKKYNP